MTAAWTLIALWGVVDVLDADAARIEWEGNHFAFVGRSALPADVREGDRLRLRLVTRPTTNFLAFDLSFVDLPRAVRGAVVEQLPRRTPHFHQEQTWTSTSTTHSSKRWRASTSDTARTP